MRFRPLLLFFFWLCPLKSDSLRCVNHGQLSDGKFRAWKKPASSTPRENVYNQMSLCGDSGRKRLRSFERSRRLLNFVSIFDMGDQKMGPRDHHSNWLKRLHESAVNIMQLFQRRVVTTTRFEDVKMAREKKTNVIKYMAYGLLAPLLFGIKKVRASAGVVGGGSQLPKSNITPWQGLTVWVALFTLSALLHGAESAITKISPYKVQEFAEEEGEGSPFATLSGNLTRLLSTILLTTTACSIYSTALFVATAVDFFPDASLGTITAMLTAVTLFFGELLPKAMAVSNSELVARTMVPFISRLATILMPVTTMITFLSDVVLRLFGLKIKEDNSV